MTTNKPTQAEVTQAEVENAREWLGYDKCPDCRKQEPAHD